jgi:hypothetical protein
MSNSQRRIPTRFWDFSRSDADENAARAFIELRTRPHLTPGVTGDEILEFRIERCLARIRLVDPGISERLAALRHPGIVMLPIVLASPPVVIGPSKTLSARSTTPSFILSLGICALIVAWLCGSANTMQISLSLAASLNDPQGLGP